VAINPVVSKKVLSVLKSTFPEETVKAKVEPVTPQAEVDLLKAFYPKEEL
jgi:hypothetical protein